MGFSDSHCHLDSYTPERLIEVIKEAKSKQVDIMLSVGMSLESSEEVIRLAQSHDRVLAAVGVHPWNPVPPDEDLRQRLAGLARREGVVAISEIGLDYARNPETREVQKELLRYELSLALETGLPVNVHCREAHEDMMNMVRNEIGSGLKGNVHGFSGDRAALKEWLDLGFYVSIGRSLLRDDMESLPEAVRDIPLDRLLTETDASGRGTGSPADVITVAQKLASIRGETAEQIGDAATAPRIVSLNKIIRFFEFARSKTIPCISELLSH